MSEIFLDTETTGLSFREGHKIIEIACIETKDLIPTGNIFHKIINPKREVPLEATKIHGFTTDFLKNKEAFDSVADEFIGFIHDKNIIIHNAPFDVGFLNNELRALGRDEVNKKRVIDTLEIARGKYSSTSNSLDALCRKFNIDLSRRKKHNALLDCELLREVYINLLDAKEPKLVFTSNKKQNEFSNLEKDHLVYNKKIIKPDNADLEKHKNFLKKELKKNFY